MSGKKKRGDTRVFRLSEKETGRMVGKGGVSGGDEFGGGEANGEGGKRLSAPSGRGSKEDDHRNLEKKGGEGGKPPNFLDRRGELPPSYRRGRKRSNANINLHNKKGELYVLPINSRRGGGKGKVVWDGQAPSFWGCCPPASRGGEGKRGEANFQ